MLREVRDVAEREIDELRSDVFEQLRAEIHGKRTSDPQQDATRMTFRRRRKRRRKGEEEGGEGVYASREKRNNIEVGKGARDFAPGQGRRVFLQHRGLLLRFERKREHAKGVDRTIRT